MIVTREWLGKFIDISNISTEKICEALNSIGLEVDSVKQLQIPQKVVIGYVKECIKHPDATKLNICQVDIGSTIVQIVCGAKNVAEGQFVPVATVGANLGDDFIIKEAKLRGVDSHGMICSSTEIGLPKLNDGIMVLDDSVCDLKIGQELNIYPFFNDTIIDIELTANRGDCLSIYGITRELSTYFNIPISKDDLPIESNHIGIGQVLDIKCDNDIESNLIYKAANIENYSLPLLYQLRVGLIDISKNTDIETLIAYVSHTTGVLLNVYTNAIANKQKDKVSLNITKNEDGFDTVVGKIPLSIIGVESGQIEKEDNNIIIEASYINPEILSQKVFDTKIKTGDFYYKASRGSEPDIQMGIEFAVGLLSKLGATIYNGSEDFIDDLQEQTLTVTLDKINLIIGEVIPKEKVIEILNSLGFIIKDRGNDTLNITIPHFRHDIKNIADITEEIVRIIGIDNIKAKPLKIAEVNRINTVSNKIKLNNKLRLKAISNGFYETITYIFAQRDLLEKYNFATVIAKKDILNPIVLELNTFRTTLALNLVQAVSSNIKQGFKSIALFESGIIFDKQRDEKRVLGFIFSGDIEQEAVRNHGKPNKIDFFAFAQKLSNIVGNFELEPLDKIDNNFIHPYQSANIIQNGQTIGQIYKLHPTVAQDFDIFDDTYLAQIDFDKLNDNLIQANDISKFQSSKRDLSVIAPKSMDYKQIKNVLDNLNIQEIKQYNLIDIYSDDKLGSNQSLTIKFVLQSETKTLQEEDIVKIMDQILAQLKEQLNIGLR